MAPLRHSLLLSVILFFSVVPHIIVGRWEHLIQQGSCSCSTLKPVNERSAKDLIKKLDLILNEEKGYYIQTFQYPDNIRYLNCFASTAIYYFLKGSNEDLV